MWVPRSAAELEAAVSSEAVSESHSLDFKSFTDSGGIPGSAAKCAASLAVDGGVLVLGVAEDKAARRFTARPVPLAGLRDAADASIAARVSPFLRSTVNELDRGDGTGYLCVVIGASPRAPHMVDGRYYGRTDTAAVPLSDVDVRRLWSRHRDRAGDASLLLAAEVAREPLRPEHRSRGRLFVVAQPVSADPRLLLDASGGDLMEWLREKIRKSQVFKQHRTYSPTIAATLQRHRRAYGVALSTYHVGSDREVAGYHQDARKAIDFEIREDGGSRLYYGRTTDMRRGTTFLMLEAIGGEVSGVIELARVVSEDTGFVGAWQFGVALRGIKSLTAYSQAPLNTEPAMYSEDSYDETTEADHASLFDSGSPVLEELVGRLVRTLAPHLKVAALDVFLR